jgi:hypothetical protein
LWNTRREVAPSMITHGQLRTMALSLAEVEERET